MAQGLDGLGPVYGAALLLSAALAAWGAWLCARGLGALWDARWFARLGAGPRSTRGAMWGAAGGATAIIAGGVIAAILLHAGLPDGAGTVAQRASMVGSLSLVLAGLVVVLVGLRFDPPGARARCPRCWYDMASLATGSACPECGHTPRDARALTRTRRSGALIALGLVLLAVSYPLSRWPAMRATSWRAMVPSTLLIAGWRWLPETLVLGNGVSESGALEDRVVGESAAALARWQRRWLAGSVEDAWKETTDLAVARRAVRMRLLTTPELSGGCLLGETIGPIRQPTPEDVRMVERASAALAQGGTAREDALAVLRGLVTLGWRVDWSVPVARSSATLRPALREDATSRAAIFDLLRSCVTLDDGFVDDLVALAEDPAMPTGERDAALVTLGDAMSHDRSGLTQRLGALLREDDPSRRLRGLTMLRASSRFRAMDDGLWEFYDRSTRAAMADSNSRVAARALALRLAISAGSTPERELIDALLHSLRDTQGEARVEVLEVLSDAPILPMLTLPFTVIDLEDTSDPHRRALAERCWQAGGWSPTQLTARERAWLEGALMDQTLPEHHAAAMRALLSRHGG